MTDQQAGPTQYGEDIAQITQTLLRERQGRDCGWWDQMRETFAADSMVRLSWYQGDGAGFVAGSQRMSAGGDPARHRLSPPVVHLDGDRAIAELPCTIEMPLQIHGVPAYLISNTRLNYRLRRDDGRWSVVQLDAIYERDSVVPVAPGDHIDISSDDLAGNRSSYALITYHLRSRGHDIPDDLLGDDRPEAVDRFYDELWHWLRTGEKSPAAGRRRVRAR